MMNRTMHLGGTQPLPSRDCKGAVRKRPGTALRRVRIQLPVTPEGRQVAQASACEAELSPASRRDSRGFARMFGWAVILGALACSLASLLPAADQKTLPWEKNRIQSGQALYRANCVVCHDIDRSQADTKKLGPSFYQLFRQPTMPLAGMKPNRGYIKERIQAGGAIMPAFGKTLNDSEIDLLLDYIQSK